jgi:hypothetical protein
MLKQNSPIKYLATRGDNKGIIKRDIKKNTRQGLRLKGSTRNKAEPGPGA